MNQSIDHIRKEIYSELRSIIRLLAELKKPLSSFTELPFLQEGRPRFKVDFDTSPPNNNIKGLMIRVNQLKLPDEKIGDAIYNLCKSIWHLKDRLKIFVKSNKLDYDVEEYVNEHKTLLVCADLANHKKHGANSNRSGINPKINTEIIFDTSNCGLIELFYDGTRKEKELRVSNPAPISFRAEILDGKDRVISPHATVYLKQAFDVWEVAVNELNVLSDDDSEGRALKKDLFIHTGK